MHLPGRLSSTTLGDLLGALHREGVTGLLELSELRGPRGLTVPGRVHRIHLRAGLVVAVETPRAEHTREALDIVFAVEDAAITFRTARPLAVRPVPLQPRDFLFGRPRARDRGRPVEHEDTPPPRSGVRPVFDEARDRARRLLGITDATPPDDVRRAFRKLASTLHPDRLGEGTATEQRQRAMRFAELSAAYHLLVA
jgi:hypothetical protein